MIKSITTANEVVSNRVAQIWIKKFNNDDTDLESNGQPTKLDFKTLREAIKLAFVVYPKNSIHSSRLLSLRSRED